MGGVGDFLFGSEGEAGGSSNRAYDEIENYFQPGLGYFTQGGDAIANLLGVGPPRVGTTSGNYGPEGGGATGSGGSGGAGGAGQVGALENWANSGGMQFLREQGNKQITSNQAAKGLLGSGSTLTALTKYGQGLGSTYLNKYMDNLFNFSRLGLGAAGAMTGAGQVSTGPTQGKSGALPQLISAAATAGAFSDDRLKENVVKIGTRKDGIDIVEFNYKQDAPVKLPEGRFRGVVAQQVAELRPELLGKPVAGYLTVKELLRPERID